MCHDNNFVEAPQREVTRYLQLEDVIQGSHFQVQTIPIQVACRGFVDIESLEGIKETIVGTINKRLWKAFLQDTMYVPGQYQSLIQYMD